MSNPTEYLITYAYHKEANAVSFHYGVVESIEKWIDDMQRYKDGPYVLVNVLEISSETADRWRGSLRSM